MKRQMNSDINLEELVQENVQQQLRMLGKNYRMGGIGTRSSFPSSNEPGKSTTKQMYEKRNTSKVQINSDTSDDTPELGHNYRMNTTPFENSLEISGSDTLNDSRELGNSYRAADNEQPNTSNYNDEPEILGNSYRMAVEPSSESVQAFDDPQELNDTADNSQVEDEFLPPQMLGRNYRTVTKKYRNQVQSLASRYRLLEFDDFDDETSTGQNSLTMGTQRSVTRKRKSR